MCEASIFPQDSRRGGRAYYDVDDYILQQDKDRLSGQKLGNQTQLWESLRSVMSVRGNRDTLK